MHSVPGPRSLPFIASFCFRSWVSPDSETPILPQVLGFVSLRNPHYKSGLGSPPASRPPHSILSPGSLTLAPSFVLCPPSLWAPQLYSSSGYLSLRHSIHPKGKNPCGSPRFPTRTGASPVCLSPVYPKAWVVFVSSTPLSHFFAPAHLHPPLQTAGFD